LIALGLMAVAYEVEVAGALPLARVQLVFVPLLGVAASYAVWRVSRLDFRGTRALVVLLSVILVGTTAHRAWTWNVEELARAPYELVELGQWFHRNESPEGASVGIYARKPHVAYYTGLRFERMPIVDSAAELVARARAEGIRYVYYGTKEFELRPALRALASDRAVPPPGLTLLYRRRIDDPPIWTSLYRVD
jgi:hypothetical protein